MTQYKLTLSAAQRITAAFFLNWVDAASNYSALDTYIIKPQKPTLKYHEGSDLDHKSKRNTELSLQLFK